MGLFKAKSSSRSETKAIFQPFSMSRRLTKISEEDGDSDLSFQVDGEKRENKKKNYPKGTPNKNKATPTRTKHRFQKLVEWDYGPAEVQEPYQPPQDFLSIQKTREDLFYENGPEKNKVVKVSSSSLDKALKSSQKNGGGINLFQFAADTASLSKSCSSDSSVTSASVSLKRPSRDTESICRDVPTKFQRSQNSTKIPKLDNTRGNGRSVFQNRHGATPPVKNTDRPSVQPLTREQDTFATQPGSFAPAGEMDSQNGFEGSSWPIVTTFHDDEATQTSDLTGSTAQFGSTTQDVFRPQSKTVSFNPFPVAEEVTHEAEQLHFQVQSQRADEKSLSEKSLSTRAKALVQKTQTLLDENKALFETSNLVEVSELPIPFTKAESPFKENENAGVFHDSSSIFRSKNVQVDKDGFQQPRPVTRTPPRVDSRSQTTKTSTPGRVLAARDNVLEQHMQRPSEHPKTKDTRPNVSFRFEFDNDTTRARQAEAPRASHRDVPAIRRNPQRNPVANVDDNLGALPKLSPNSMHLFVDKASSYDESVNKIESFASTIESCESNSTATSVSTFVDASPRGIRGGFPNHMALSSSTLSTSTASTSFMNEINNYKSKSSQGSTGRRPPPASNSNIILGSALFQAVNEDFQSNASTKTLSPKRRGVPFNIHATDDAAVSDVTGTTSASDWMIQGNKLLSRYYYNNDGQSNSHTRKPKISRQLRSREAQNTEEYQRMMETIQKERRMNSSKNKVNSFMSDFNERNDPVDKMRRHQHKFQYPSPSRQVRSGFDNRNDDDASSLFEA